MRKFLYSALAVIAILSTSCNKDCYNPSLENQYKNAVCPTDCPGVTGCDGKTYCNECEANKLGVAVE
ncbi:MAG: hypothetical protein KDC13_07880 [Bacteroidetes bacterium]|nr:hypothetical protein [Bacteroidota bacterium]